jgi:small subunit ribosomal protein S29
VQLSSQLTIRPAQNTFSTTHARAALTKPKKLPTALAAKTRAKGSKNLNIKKNSVVKTGKPPQSGERKAMRKRIVLSNTNALPVEMQDLEKEMLLDEQLVGSVVGLSPKVVDSLRAAEAFRPTQGWGLFRRPGMLIRAESLVMNRKLVDAEEGKGSFRVIVDGDRVTGKSMMLLHAMATAFLRGWIVINIPDGKSPTALYFDTG